MNLFGSKNDPLNEVKDSLGSITKSVGDLNKSVDQIDKSVDGVSSELTNIESEINESFGKLNGTLHSFTEMISKSTDILHPNAPAPKSKIDIYREELGRVFGILVKWAQSAEQNCPDIHDALYPALDKLKDNLFILLQFASNVTAESLKDGGQSTEIGINLKITNANLAVLKANSVIQKEKKNPQLTADNIIALNAVIRVALNNVITNNKVVKAFWKELSDESQSGKVDLNKNINLLLDNATAAVTNSLSAANPAPGAPQSDTKAQPTSHK